MEKLFLEVLNMSITATYVILVVITMRLLIRKAPKIFSYVLWSVVLFRLICPFSFESMFSLMPMNSKPIPQEIVYEQNPRIESGVDIVDNVVNPYIPKPNEYDSVNPMQVLNFIGAYIWLLGIVVIASYTIMTTIKLYRNIKNSKHLKYNIYELKNIGTPFVFGIIKPKIYIPRGLNDKEMSYIIKHEETHIRRNDHIIKVLGFIIVAIHWFNPFVWIAFRLMENDMELSCDERVIKELGNEIKKDYSKSLLSLSAGKRVVISPIAFGENGIKGRIKNVLNYKKPRFWIATIVSIVIVIESIGLMSNPKMEEQDLSFVNPDNLISTVMDRDKVRVDVIEMDGYTYLTGNELGQWIDKVKWKETNKSSLYGLRLTFIIRDIFDNDAKSQITINYGNPIIATVGYDLSSKRYIISEEDFKELERMVALKSYFEPYSEEDKNIESIKISKYKDHQKGIEKIVKDKTAIESIKNLMLSGKLTSKDSVSESPNVDEYVNITITYDESNVYYSLYEKNNRYYLEQPYSGIWEISEENYQGIIEISEKYRNTSTPLN